ncbi:hypothetical protein C8R45DRAFT_995708 [Mycena sanguinolenta]|nr:hypothetical protein C8R45DRAFT_995708 [Mycena sanguinolenta]
MWVTLSLFSIRIALNATCRTASHQSLGPLQDFHGEERHNGKAWSRSCAFATARTIQLECREPASRLIPRE